MICPSCGLPMKQFVGREPFCSQCGLRLSEFNPRFDGSEAGQGTDPQPNRKRSASTQTRKRLSKAKQMTELRRALKDLSGRLNDLEIQFDRRLEEMQTLVVKLSTGIESIDET